MRVATPTIDAAEKMLRALCAEMTGTGSARLPSILEMARRGGVSVPTMWKAVQRLKNEGVLDARPRAGIVVLHRAAAVHGVRPHMVPPTLRRRWETVSEALARDIIRGAYSPGGTLPSVKELVRRYGASSQTTRRALTALAAGRLVVHERRIYRVPVPQGRPRAEIILAARADENGDVAIITPRTIGHLQALENACSVAGVQLTPVTWSMDGELRYTRTRELFAPERHRQGILGFVVWTLTMHPGLFSRLCRAMAGHGVPVAVFDENGETAGADLPKRPATVRVFPLSDNAHAGRAVASLLVNNGHRSVVFLGPVSEPFPTIHTRLAGLRQGFASAGIGDAVHVADSAALPWSSVAIREHRHLGLRLAWLASEAPVGDETVREGAKRLSRAIGVERMEDENARACREILQPHIRAGCRAVVAFSDDLALTVLRMARLEKIRVPQDLSVAGFDNIQEGAMERLTTWDLNGTAGMNAMLSWILNPRGPAFSKGTGPVVVEGNLIVRGSVGPVRTGDGAGRTH